MDQEETTQSPQSYAPDFNDSQSATGKPKRPRGGNGKNKGRINPERRAVLTPNVAGNYRGRKSAEELLSDKDKKLHHIASEQKRRRNIKIGYERLSTLVPKLKDRDHPNPPSETLILQESVDFLSSLVASHEHLKAKIDELSRTRARASQAQQLNEQDQSKP